MQFEAGDIVSLAADDRRLVVVSKLDARLLWVRLLNSDRAHQYAFRPEDLRLVAKSEPAAVPLLFSPVPPAALSDTDPIAA